MQIMEHNTKSNRFAQRNTISQRQHLLVVVAVAVVECSQPDTSESDGYRSAKSGISHPFCGKLLSYGERQMG